MLTIWCTVLLPLLVVGATNEVTFKNVEFKGYNVYTLKFTETIISADTLKPQLPNQVVDHIEFTRQNIPVLKKDSISGIEDLDELTIKECELKEIQPGAFVKVSFLRKLSLKGNLLENIQTGVFNGLQLSMLDLSKNRIKNIADSALNDLPNLLNIDLADNLIESWNERWFENVPLLTRVSMQNNSLEKIQENAFKNLNGNKKFGSVTLTINLVFSYNKIKQIEEGAFEGLGNINHLWLDNNELTDFGENLLENVEVEDLRIEHNNISCLKGDLSKIIKAQTTHIDGNPFDCACLGNIKTWVEKNNKTVDLFYSDMDCVADRIRKKLNSLERRLKGIKSPKEIEETTSLQRGDSESEVEVFLK